MNRTRITRWTRKLHRGLGLLVAIQVVLWIAGGLIMASLDLQRVRGLHYAAKQPVESLELKAVTVSPAQVLEGLDLGASAVAELRLVQWQGQPVYRVRPLADTARPQLVSAHDGVRLSPLDEPTARRIAQADYAGPGRLVDAQWLETVPSEARGRRGPLWRIQFDDAIDTALYVSADTGQVVARRNNWWRLFDVVWMLHIMDYDTRDDFNHPVLVLAAASALLFALSGVLLLGLAWWPRGSRPAAGTGR